MQVVRSITLQNVRCFEHKTFTFDAPIVVIEGANGSGKSSLIEALSYCCYLKSFRTSRVADMVNFDDDGASFFIKLDLEDREGEDVEIRVGFDNGSKRVKVNGKTVQTYKDILSLYRAVSLAELDLALIAGGPEERRSFLNQLCVLEDARFVDTMREYKKVLKQRNALLSSGQPHRFIIDQLSVWTQRLWELSKEIQDSRVRVMKGLEKHVNQLLSEIDRTDLFVGLLYVAKKRENDDSWDSFWARYQNESVHKEIMMRRSLFGAHLDDMTITVADRPARIFASRGQQKLLLVLLKIAQVRQLQESSGQDGGIILLLDDFLTDFDEVILNKIIALISQLACQIIITCPLHDVISVKNAHCIKMRSNSPLS